MVYAQPIISGSRGGGGGGIGIAIIVLFIVIGAVLVYIFRCKLLGWDCPSTGTSTGASPSPEAPFEYCSKPGEGGISKIYIRPSCIHSQHLLTDLAPTSDMVIDCSHADNANTCIDVGGNPGVMPGYPGVLCADQSTLYIGYKK